MDKEFQSYVLDKFIATLSALSETTKRVGELQKIVAKQNFVIYLALSLSILSNVVIYFKVLK